MQNLNNHKKTSRGIAIVLTTLTLSVLLPLVGLGFDVGTLYLIKSKLSAATDSAALAGARALSQGATPSAQAASAVSAAQAFFAGNFPTGYWNTSGAAAGVAVDDTSTPNYRTVTVSATVQAPLYFLRVLNQQYSTINVTSSAGRRDVLLMMVLDRSISMNGIIAGTGQTACALMKADAAEFVSYFAPGRDQLGLVAFGSSVYCLSVHDQLHHAGRQRQHHSVPYRGAYLQRQHLVGRGHRQGVRGTRAGKQSRPHERDHVHDRRAGQRRHGRLLPTRVRYHRWLHPAGGHAGRDRAVGRRRGDQRHNGGSDERHYDLHHLPE